MLGQIASRFNTSVEVVSHIVQGRTYRELEPVEPVSARGIQSFEESGLGAALFPLSLVERFWSKVQKSEGCWTWKAGFYRTGYGAFHVKRKKRFAHRVAYEFEIGPIPVGKVVMHTCDNPACVRPEHLRVGDQAENVADMIQKKRDRRPNLKGAENGRAKLTEEDVREIRRRLRAGATQTELALEYGVALSNIGHIVHGRSWGFLSE